MGNQPRRLMVALASPIVNAVVNVLVAGMAYPV
jgi:hypothetical protein